VKKCRSPWEIKAEETGTGRIEFVVTNQQEHQNPKHMLRPVKNHLKALIEDQDIYIIIANNPPFWLETCTILKMMRFNLMMIYFKICFG
jgi:hypothetical protein